MSDANKVRQLPIIGDLKDVASVLSVVVAQINDIVKTMETATEHINLESKDE